VTHSRIEAVRRLAADPDMLGGQQFRPDATDDVDRDLIRMAKISLDMSVATLAQRWLPVVASSSWAVTRTRSPALRTLPSRT
jgi:hypothetical protein